MWIEAFEYSARLQSVQSCHDGREVLLWLQNVCCECQIHVHAAWWFKCMCVCACVQVRMFIGQVDESTKSYQAAIFNNAQQYQPNKYGRPIYIGYGHFALEKYF
jgi:hypothetical protein